MMAAIIIDKKAVCMEHDFNGMTPEYFWNFLLDEYIPAYKDELTVEEIREIYKGIEEKKDHIYIRNGSTGRFSHSFVYVKPFIFSEQPKYEFDGF